MLLLHYEALGTVYQIPLQRYRPDASKIYSAEKKQKVW